MKKTSLTDSLFSNHDNNNKRKDGNSSLLLFGSTATKKTKTTLTDSLFSSDVKKK